MRLLLFFAGVLLWASPALASDLEMRSFPDAPASLRPELWDAFYVKGEVLEHTLWTPRPTVDTRRILEKLASKRPAEAVIQRHLAEVLVDLGQHGPAKVAMGRAETLARDALWPLEDLAHYSASRGNRSGQLGALKRLAARRGARLKTHGEPDRLAEVLRQIADLIERHQLSEDPLRYRRQAAELFPERIQAGTEVIRWLLDRERTELALEHFAWARRHWPNDHAAIAREEVELLFRLERIDRAREVLLRELAHDDGLDQTWVASTFVNKMRQGGGLEGELRRARSFLRGEVTPSIELAEAVQLLEAAGAESDARDALRRALRNEHGASEDDQLVLAALCCRVGQDDDATRILSRLAVSSRGPARDEAQVRLALLLASGRGPERSSGLQALLDPERLDPGPSIVGGLLSMLLGGPLGSSVTQALREHDTHHLHAAQAAALMEETVARRPGWSRLPQLERRLIELYRTYDAARTAFHASQRFLARYPEHPAYFSVGLEAAGLSRDAGQDPVLLLRALVQKALQHGDDEAHRRVLRAYEEELGREQRHDEVIAAYWSAVEARPDDVHLYNNLLRFLSRHNLHDEQQMVYRRAIARFDGGDWASRYSRWLVRHRGAEADEALTRRLLEALGPSELAQYLQNVLQRASGRGEQGGTADQLFLEIYLEALRRHPGELDLVRRLYAFYSRRPRHYEAERLDLLVRYAPYDERMRDELYRTLARREELDRALDQLRRSDIAAGRLLAMDFFLRRAEPHSARGALTSLLTDLPGHRELTLQLATLEGSLGHESEAGEVLRSLLENLPVDWDLLTRAGELDLAADDLVAARHHWARIHESARGDRRAYLRVATLYWNRTLFDDAIRTLLAAREAFSDDSLFALELAVVHESSGNKAPAAREYIGVLADAARGSATWPSVEMENVRAGSAHGALVGSEISPPENELVHCMNRLVAMASRPGDRAVVEAVFRGLISQSPDDHGLLHIRVDLLERTGWWDRAHQILADAALQTNAASIHERAIARLTAAGHEREVTAILHRLAQNRSLDISPTFRLADDLERRRHIQSAAAALRSLSQRLEGDDDRRRDRESVEVRLARLLYAHGRFDDALAAAARALELAQGSREGRLRVEIGRWLIRLGRAQDAVEMIGPALTQSPDMEAALQAHAEALVALGGRDDEERPRAIEALQERYEAAIESAVLRRSDREVALREQLIEYLAQLDAHRAALDQHVTLLDDEPENEERLRRAYLFASVYGLRDDLEERYQDDSESGPRGHLRALVRARLAAARGDLRRASQQMDSVLDAMPERADLHQERIGFVLRQLDDGMVPRLWREAALLYGRLAELDQVSGDTGAPWIAEEARMHGRLGDWEAMAEAVGRLLSVDVSDPRFRLDAAELYAQAGRWDDAWQQGRAAFELWGREPGEDDRVSHLRLTLHRPEGLSTCAELAVRAGRWREGADMLRRLERSWTDLSESSVVTSRAFYRELASTARLARTETIAASLHTYGVDRDIRDFVSSLRREIAASEIRDEAQLAERLAMAQLATTAGSPQGHLDLLGVLLRRLRGRERSIVLRELISRHEAWGSPQQLHDLLLEEHRTLETDEWLAVRLRAAGAFGDRSAEEGALLALLEEAAEPSFDHESVVLERLLTSRWHAGGDAQRSIPLLSRPGANSSGQVINFLIQQGDTSGAREALERFGEAEGESLWLDTARTQVMLREVFSGEGSTLEHEPFTRVLDLRTIGEQVDAPVEHGCSLDGQRWADLAQRYGAALALEAAEPDESDDIPAGNARLEYAGIESDPRSSAAQILLGDEALQRSDTSKAATHFRLARQLTPRDPAVKDGLARALLAADRRSEALALWSQAFGTCADERCLLEMTRSMSEAGLEEEAMTRLVTFLRRGWRSERFSLRPLRELAAIHGEGGRGRDSPLDLLAWELWQLDRDRLDLLQAVAGVGASSPLLTGRARGRYLRQGLHMFGPNSTERPRWIRAYVNYLIEYDEHRPLIELLDRYETERESTGHELPLDLQLALARGHMGLNQRNRALERLTEVADEEPEAAIRLLQEMGYEREALELQVDAARRRLASGDDRSTVYVAAVEALLELARADEALELVRQASTSRVDNIAALCALADVLETHSRPLEAFRLRRIVYRVNRSDYENLLAIARLDMTLGRLDRARRRALSLLARWAVPAQVEAGATELLVALALNHRRQQRRVIAALTEALDEHSLDEDRALALARVQLETQSRRAAQVVMGRSIREATSPWRSLELIASWEVQAGNLTGTARLLEGAMIHSAGSQDVRRQLFTVRHRMGEHQAALAALELAGDRPAGVEMLRGLDEEASVDFALQMSESAMALERWVIADAYTMEALRRIDVEADPERAREVRTRLGAIRTASEVHRAAGVGRPWIRRGP